jgi:uncharacterized protein (UPF0210 family)
MKIRAITVFADLGPPLDEEQIAGLGRFAQAARHAFEDDGIVVQTVRLATHVFRRLPASEGADKTIPFVVTLEQVCQQHGFDYVALGPADRANWSHLGGILEATRSRFFTIDITDRSTGTVAGDAIRGATAVMRQAMTAEPDGFANLRFAALANVEPGTPFFPSAYYGGGPPSFAIATEAADLAVEACTHAGDAAEAQRRLITAIESHARQLERRAGQLAHDHHVRFGGIDFSLAPFPNQETSIGSALELLSGQPLGGAGTLAAAAVLTDAIARARFSRCGFCGLMLPVLEDSTLARRAAEGRYQVADLLQWSAVCGTGLDTVPLPGDVSEEALAALLFDVATLAVRADKPLSARLMPLPGKTAGDPATFDFGYFTDSRVLPLQGGERQGLLRNTSALHLTHHSRQAGTAP